MTSVPTANDVTHDTIENWFSGKPVVGLMGEFSAGKSTLLNFMLDYEAAPTKVTATPLPPTWFTYSEETFAIGVLPDGKEEAVDITDETLDLRHTYVMLRRGVPCEILKRCDIIDPPGISDPELRKDALRFLARYIDFVLWCTPAAQAWRQTEQTAFKNLAQATREKSLLLITRFDKLRNDKDKQKVLSRVTREAGSMFSHVIPMQTTKAADVPQEQRNDTPDGPWIVTGGHALEIYLTESLENTTPKLAKKKPVKKPAAQAAAPKAKVVAKPAASEAKKPAVVEPKKTVAQLKEAAAPVAEKVTPVKATQSLVETLTVLKQKHENAPYCSEIDHLIASFAGENAIDRQENTSLQICGQINDHGLEIEKLLSQIGREISAFGNGEKFRLDQ